MILSQRIGDSKTHSIPLSWNGRPFAPGNGWLLLFTAKLDPDTETDEDAVFQKATGAGITVAGNKVSLTVLPQDTEDLQPITIYWDIQATRDIEVDGQLQGEVQTVASGTMPLIRDVGRESEPTLDVFTVAPPFLYFSYQSYLLTNPPAPVLTEEQWVSRLGTSNPDIVSTVPPLPSRGAAVGRTFAMPYDGLQWFDPSDGSTSAWMWYVDGVEESEDDGTFVSQFPTPVLGDIPDGAMQDENGAYYVDETGAYYVLT